MHSLNSYLSPILDAIEQFLNGCSQCNEHQIITYLQEKKVAPFEQFSLADSQDLFSAHFLCMHALYHLKKHYRQTKQFALVIESVRIQRIALSTVMEVTDDSSTALERNDPLEEYYLNAKHYFDTQENEINEMIKSFWQRYFAQDNKQEALKVLGLPASADANMVKAQYLRLVQVHHPDKGGCAEMFNQIRQAKSVLDKTL
ncbi:DNA-J related domain-containing protein [Thalassotalea piscium]|uniref:J domain-containing protein n=1 Tax=Thalassotalea piscium TaxID=1230533 RepID=A0A7X0TUJ0_9GAMM|nr:DNA-J related domain-containing protein [Thalassotalea piscium]MBB6544199.1 hypothetical protein [Thalassotalea piscium]